MDEERIEIEVRREVCRANARVAGWRWVSAPPHVQRFVTGTFAEVVAELAASGYQFTVCSQTVEVSMLNWYCEST